MNVPTFTRLPLNTDLDYLRFRLEVLNWLRVIVYSGGVLTSDSPRSGPPSCVTGSSTSAPV